MPNPSSPIADKLPSAEAMQAVPAAPRISASVRRLNRLARELGAQRYLEIGVQKGLTFMDIEVAHKTAVDPKFLFDTQAAQREGLSFASMTSDAFFDGLARDAVFDLMFIDGLHTFEQTYRDLCNALLHSHLNTVFLIDDVRPNDVYSAMPLQAKALTRRREALGEGASKMWHGDVFKVIFALHDFHPGLNFRTLTGSGNPQTLVWRGQDGGRKPRFNSLEAISRLSYFDLLDHLDLMRNTGEDQALGLCLEQIRG